MTQSSAIKSRNWKGKRLQNSPLNVANILVEKGFLHYNFMMKDLQLREKRFRKFDFCEKKFFMHSLSALEVVLLPFRHGSSSFFFFFV